MALGVMTVFFDFAEFIVGIVSRSLKFQLCLELGVTFEFFEGYCCSITGTMIIVCFYLVLMNSGKKILEDNTGN